LANVDLTRLAKLIALAVPPSSGPDGEARAAALAACAIIREHKLAVIDPSDVPPQPKRSETFEERYRRVVDANPVRVAMKKRELERAEAAARRDAKAKFVVGAPVNP